MKEGIVRKGPRYDLTCVYCALIRFVSEGASHSPLMKSCTRCSVTCAALVVTAWLLWGWWFVDAPLPVLNHHAGDSDGVADKEDSHIHRPSHIVPPHAIHGGTPHAQEPQRRPLAPPHNVGGWSSFLSVVCLRVAPSTMPRWSSAAGRFDDAYDTGNDNPYDIVPTSSRSSRDNQTSGTTTRDQLEAQHELQQLCREGVMSRSSSDHSSTKLQLVLRILFPSSTVATVAADGGRPLLVPSPSQGWNWSAAAHNNGNGAVARRSSVGHPTLVQRYSEDPRSRFCYYVLRNACVEHGQVMLLQEPSNGSEPPPPLSPLSQLKGKPFRLCNELRRKYRLHYSVASSAPSLQDKEQRHMSSPSLHPNGHVASCWQYYGFHLFHCLASLFVTQLQHNMPNVDMFLFNHAASLHESSRDHFSHQLILGSATNFTDGNERRHVSKDVSAMTRSHVWNAYWGMWAQNSKSPSQIDEVFSYAKQQQQHKTPPSATPRQCYERLLVGQVVHHELTVPQRRVHAWWLQSVLLTQYHNGEARQQHHLQRSSWLLLPDVVDRSATRRSFSASAPFMVTIVDRQNGKRQGSRSVVNIGSVVKSVVESLVATPSTYTGTWTADALQRANADRYGCIQGAPSHRFVETALRSSQPQDRALSVSAVVVCLVDWAMLPLAVQAAVAQATDITIAAHGGGNTWIALQQPHTVFIELWHAPYVPRNVFVSMAREYNVRYYAHLRRDVAAPGNFMNQNVVVDVPQLLGIIDSAVGYRMFAAPR